MDKNVICDFPESTVVSRVPITSSSVVESQKFLDTLFSGRQNETAVMIERFSGKKNCTEDDYDLVIRM